MYRIQYADGAREELNELVAGVRREIVRAIEEQLRHDPTVETRNRKPLSGFRLPFEHRSPLWELRVRDYRIYYDADEEAELVTVRAIRHKPPHRTTEEVV